MIIKNLKKLSSIFFVLLCISVLTACSLSASEKKTENLKITLLASEKMNPNTHGRAAPLRIYIFELKTPDMFYNSDFYSLTNNFLPQSQLNVLYDAIILPGEKRNIEIKTVKSNIMLGVVAAYRDINHSGWKRTVLVQDVQPSPWWGFKKSEVPKTLNISFGKKSISTIEWVKM